MRMPWAGTLEAGQYRIAQDRSRTWRDREHDVARKGQKVDTADVLVNPAQAEAQLAALREQRRLLGDLIDDIARTRQGMQQRIGAAAGGGFGVTAAWRSPSSNAYDRRAAEMTRRVDDLNGVLQAALEAVHRAIARLTAGI